MQKRRKSRTKVGGGVRFLYHSSGNDIYWKCMGGGVLQPNPCSGRKKQKKKTTHHPTNKKKNHKKTNQKNHQNKKETNEKKKKRFGKDRTPSGANES